MAEAKILQCHIQLVDSEPPIWRRFRVSDQMLLASLHPVLQVVMGWQNSHLHAFKIGDIFYADPAPVPQEETHDSTSQKLADFQFSAGSQFLYNYDFGDGWLHQITVEHVLPLEAEAPSLTCIEGERACPPEDCGGIWGYEDLLERLEDPEDPEYEDLLDWVGADFDPEAFNVNAVNRQLTQQPFTAG
jgi:hypothetical protein